MIVLMSLRGLWKLTSPHLSIGPLKKLRAPCTPNPNVSSLPPDSDEYLTLPGPRWVPIIKQGVRWKFTPMGHDAIGQCWYTGLTNGNNRNAWYTLTTPVNRPAYTRWRRSYSRRERTFIPGKARALFPLGHSELSWVGIQPQPLLLRPKEGEFHPRPPVVTEWRLVSKSPKSVPEYFPLPLRLCLAYTQRLRESPWYDPVVPAQYLEPSTRWGNLLWQDKLIPGKEFVLNRNRFGIPTGKGSNYVPFLSVPNRPRYTTQNFRLWNIEPYCPSTNQRPPPVHRPKH
ncbi:uncharacterized protein C19orf71 homolog [Dromiciops gliroides]|uniref:uncharacterized protein C19orf71 homolog n=1 Tax=Dromiciops gliroides TaxID=33562 RepID=UPI001CC39F8E|nr:uncharacterized protein C19orf71 homolog [Dromiciops gliroides]